MHSRIYLLTSRRLVWLSRLNIMFLQGNSEQNFNKYMYRNNEAKCILVSHLKSSDIRFRNGPWWTMYATWSTLNIGSTCKLWQVLLILQTLWFYHFHLQNLSYLAYSINCEYYVSNNVFVYATHPNFSVDFSLYFKLSFHFEKESPSANYLWKNLDRI